MRDLCLFLEGWPIDAVQLIGPSDELLGCRAAMRNSPGQNDVFRFAPYRVAGVHYIDFIAETIIAITSDGIRAPDISDKVALDERELEYLYWLLRRKDGPGHIADGRLRLIVVPVASQARFPEAWVDQTGVVKIEGQEHQLSPYRLSKTESFHGVISEQASQKAWL